MPDSSIFSRHDNKRKDAFFTVVDGLFLVGCLLSLATVLINPDQAVKVFIFSTVLSFPVIFNNRHNLLKNKKLLMLPLSIFAFGLMQIIWVAIFKQQGSPFTAAYRSYQNGGKNLIFSAFMIAAICSRHALFFCKDRIAQYVTIATGLGLYCWAGYQLYTVGSANPLAYRVPLGFEFATGTAYALTFIALLASQAILNLRGILVIPFYFIHFALSALAIVSTQTRAAILVYPVLCVALFLLNYRHKRKVLFGAFASFVILSLAALIPLKPVLEQRYIEFKNDLIAYQGDNSNTSIGARFAMQKAGLETGKLKPWGESLEQRSSTLIDLEKSDPSLSGALLYLNVHLHNEVMDTFSLKGFPGLILLLLFYATAVYVALKQKNALLLVVTGAIIAYGLNDMVLYSKGESLISMLALCFSFILFPCAMREQSYE
ncbi:O-antigen ligase family protein [Enterobacter sp. Cy-643]|uniref:O-antigen ligase family protein n=1 Tax=Enterobacter sp. Cy-643 TaxID=2608346 RepID=UPI00141DF4E3|nr:O-antigen ligase family protein [Enterobacter sp. Cy-643]NIF34571.1 O-antigen ligase family protein [Enterobacter sp. Cy-643]